MFEKGSRYYEFTKSRLPGNNQNCYGCELEGICAGQCHVTYEADQAPIHKNVENFVNCTKDYHTDASKKNGN